MHFSHILELSRRFRGQISPGSRISVVLFVAVAGCATIDTATEIQSGRQAFLNNRPEVALAHFRKVAETDPKFVASVGPLSQGIWTYVGRSYYAQGKFPEARQALNRALTLYRDDQLAKLYLGLIELRTENRNRSAQSFSREQIVYALQQGVTPVRLANLVRDRGVAFKWSSGDDQTLRSSGASDALIAEIKRSGTASTARSQTQLRQLGSQTVESAFREILERLQKMSSVREGEYWDPSGKILSRLRNTLTVNSAQPLGAESLIGEGEWLGQQLEEEVNLARLDRSMELRETSGDN